MPKRSRKRVSIALVGVQMHAAKTIGRHKGTLRHRLRRERVRNRRTAHKLRRGVAEIYLSNGDHKAAQIERLKIQLGNLLRGIELGNLLRGGGYRQQHACQQRQSSRYACHREKLLEFYFLDRGPVAGPQCGDPLSGRPDNSSRVISIPEDRTNPTLSFVGSLSSSR